MILFAVADVYQAVCGNLLAKIQLFICKAAMWFDKKCEMLIKPCLSVGCELPDVVLNYLNI